MKLIHRNHSAHDVFTNPSAINSSSILARYYPHILIMLLIIDLFFIVASWSYPSNYFPNDAFDITKEWGYGEMFQYAKEFSIAFFLIKVYKKTKDTIFIVWSLFFAYLLLDDALKIHEIIGNAIASNLISQGPHIFNLRGQDFGELAVCALMGSIFLLLFIRFFYNSRQKIKKISFNLIALVTLLLFCGIFVDMVHSALPNVSGITTLEDGGEMITMSLIFWYTLNLLKHNPETALSIINSSTIKYANFVFDHFYSLANLLHLTSGQSSKRL